MKRLGRIIALLAFASGCTQGLNPSPTPTRTIMPATFTMGSTTDCQTGACSGDRIPHKVQITRPYDIDQGTVTNFQYARCVAFKKCPAQDSLPIDTPGNQNAPAMVSYSDAVAYCEFKADPTIDHVANTRLPTEAEWELAVGSSLIPYDPRVAEWVADDYTVADGCADETPAWALCSLLGTSSRSCIDARCGGQCASACGEGYLTIAPYCIPADSVSVDPLHIAQPHRPVQKSNGPSACSGDSGYRAAGTGKAGFRCVVAEAPTATVTARVALPKLTSCDEFVITAANSPAWWSAALMGQPSSLRLTMETDAVRTVGRATLNGFHFTPPCAMDGTPPASALLIVNGAPLADFTLVFNGGPRCSLAFQSQLNGEAPVDMFTVSTNSCF